jgi:SAM-dependent methyltransferase
MSDWTSGYVADIGYTYGYYNELNPNRSTLAFLNAGYTPPSSGNHCELGYGQGLSVNIHAAASGASWYGTDFNPSQAAFAQSLVAASGADAHLTDEAFIDFCNRGDLPEFDYIGLHGIWSWISAENRAVIVDFILRKLKVGGALYISYNTLPGWASFAPMRHIMTEHASVMGAVGKGVVNRVDDALSFAQKLIDSNPLFARANSSAPERLAQVTKQNRHYLAHEYFNKDWHPMYFSNISTSLESSKVSYVCSAHYLDHVDALNLTTEHKTLLEEIENPIFKESVRDYMVNQQFRRDYWIKGPRKLSTSERLKRIEDHQVILISPRNTVSLKATGSLGEATLNEEIYNPILDFLSDHEVHTLGQIFKTVAKKANFPQVLQAILVLSGNGAISSVLASEPSQDVKISANRLNLKLMEIARTSPDIGHLASPITGGGISVNRFNQLFLLAKHQGKTTTDSWAEFVWNVLKDQGIRLVKNEKTLELESENISELKQLAKEFSEIRLPILQKLGIDI